MKLRFSILLALFSVATCWAQETVPENLAAPGETPFTIEHEVQVGVGDIFFTNSVYRNSWLIKADYFAGQTLLLSPDNYYGSTMSTGAISASYLCRVKKWMWFGASVTYSGFYTNEFDCINDQLVSRNKDHFFSILPIARFSYLNRKYVNLYSAVSIGACVEIAEKQTFNDSGKKTIERTPYGHFAFQATAIGISVGHRFYGFAELGVGMRGYFYAGFGYRFNNVKK